MIKRTNPEKLLTVEDTNEDIAPPEPRGKKLRAASRESAHQPKKPGARFDAHVEDHDKPRLRTRRRKATVNEDMFYIPIEEIPDGLTYEWKRYSNLGETNPFYIAQLREQGWEPVPPSRHPNWLPPGYNEPSIIKNGLLLMDRPAELTEEARRELRQLSKQQINDAEQRLGKTPDGQLPRDADPRVKPRITKEWNRPVPIEE